MKVKDLIEQLNKFDKDLDLIIWNADKHEYYDQVSATLDEYAIYVDPDSDESPLKKFVTIEPDSNGEIISFY